MVRIKDVKVCKVSTIIEYPGEFWEERMLRPLDIYPEHDMELKEVVGEWNLKKISNGRYETHGVFVEVESDEGVSGLFGPIGAPAGDVEAFIIDRKIKKFLVGMDPFEIEKIWDKMYRLLVHGRKGYGMMAISAIDCALWDLIGKLLNKPVYVLLGGPTREIIPAYASLLGFSMKIEDIEKLVIKLKNTGFQGLKLFLRYGPPHGIKGYESNINVIRIIRDLIGYEMKIMVDAWMSWSVDYAFKMAYDLDRYEVLWLEEPLMPDDLEGYLKLKKKLTSAGLSIKLAGGEHEYTRWGFMMLMENEIFDILQPDIAWAGGLTEVLKICDIASSKDLEVIPHTAVTASTLHLAFSRPSNLIPLIEYLVKWNIINQAPLKIQYNPQNGVFKTPTEAGLGLLFKDNISKIQLTFDV